MPKPTTRAEVVGATTPPESQVVSDDLEGGRFEPQAPDVRFERVTFRDVDFSGLRVWRLAASDATFENCDFSDLRVEHGPLALPPRVLYRECRFDCADLRHIDPGHARFEGCSFRQTRIEEWFAYCSEFIACVFTGKIKSCVFSAAPIDCAGGFFGLRRKKRLQFRGNDFREATLVDTSFVGGIDLDAQLLPDSSQYLRLNHAAQRIAAAKNLARELPDAQARDLITGALDALADDTDGQRDLLVNKNDYDDLPPQAQQALWRLLE
jgi:uncharacterized protein YjbI with pentapeptide repeats